ncbi:MAG: GNAT family N-acetyltransferase [Actinomycetota bacterium]|nr:GNAT family N-acetyltransferase [Actinomycetota bacterium]
MKLHERVVSGRERLELVTELLHRARLEAPDAEMWEAADLQWWWRMPRSSDAIGQRFWVDDDGRPVATVSLTDWSAGGRPARWGVDPIALPSRADELLEQVWAAAWPDVLVHANGRVETMVCLDDAPLIAILDAAGFVPNPEQGAATWMAAADRPAIAPLADGYRLTDRTTDGGLPHPGIDRNGPDIAARLADTSLYRPDLDLCIRSDTGEIGAYGLFWYDPVTSVGMLEPLRTEDAHQGRGLARHLVTVGLDRLARLGATRLKVFQELDNPPAVHLYGSLGFVPTHTTTEYVLELPAD